MEDIYVFYQDKLEGPMAYNQVRYLVVERGNHFYRHAMMHSYGDADHYKGGYYWMSNIPVHPTFIPPLFKAMMLLIT